jgi:hypothetical protein
MRNALAPLLFLLLASCSMTPDAKRLEVEKMDLRKMQARFAPVELKVDTSKLDPADQQALAKMVDAAKVIDDLYRNDQVWSGNRALREKLAADTSELGKARLRYFDLNQGPWADLDEHKAFVDGVPARKPLGANFYPEDMTREEFEKWEATLSPADKEQAIGFYTVIRRDAGKLKAVPFSDAYKEPLARAAQLRN